MKRLSLAWTPRRSALANIDRYCQEMILESRKPVRQFVVPAIPDDSWSQLVVPFLNYLPDDAWRWRKIETELTLLEVALAVRMHRLTHGRYPAHLADISPRWLPSVSRDLWDQPVAYRLRNGRPVIYSLGPDGVDDGGRAINPTDLRPRDRGDLVFGRISSTRWPRRRPPKAGR